MWTDLDLKTLWDSIGIEKIYAQRSSRRHKTIKDRIIIRIIRRRRHETIKEGKR